MTDAWLKFFQPTEVLQSCVPSLVSAPLHIYILFHVWFCSTVELAAGQFNYASLVYSLIPLAKCEKMAISRVADSRLLRGLELLLLGIIGALEVLRQPECMAFFRELASNNKMEVNISILSCCWSAQMIKSSFDFGMFLAKFSTHFHVAGGTKMIIPSFEFGMFLWRQGKYTVQRSTRMS